MLMSKPTTVRQAPLALTDQQMNIVRLHARLVPTALRGRYLKHIADKLAALANISDADVERAAVHAGMRLVRFSTRSASPLAAERRMDVRRAAANRSALWPNLLAVLIDGDQPPWPHISLLGFQRGEARFWQTSHFAKQRDLMDLVRLGSAGRTKSCTFRCWFGLVGIAASG